MAQDTVFDFESETEETYNPLDDFDQAEIDEEAEASEGQIGPYQSTGQIAHYDAAADERPASERIPELFERLKPRKRVMADIMRFLDTPKRADVLQEKVVELQEYDFSVYDGYSYSKLLYRAGAIDKVDENGDPFPDDYEQAPDIVEIDGMKFYKPTDGVMVFWVISEAGKEFLAKDDPEKRMEDLLHDQVIYAGIYQRVLQACSSPDGAAAQLLADLVDNDPVCLTPRRWSAFFTKRLEDCEAIRWQGSWKTTEIGKKALEILAEIIAAKEGE